MRIGIDARLLGGRHTGDRTYWRGLLAGLALEDCQNEYLLYVRETPDASMVQLFDTRRATQNFRYRVLPAKSDRVWSLVTLPNAMSRDKIDVAHVQYTVSPLFFARSICVVTTVHDITFRLFPKLFRPMDRLLLNLSVPYSVRRSCGVIAVSDNTRKDILRAYHPRPETKLVATLLAAGPEFRVLSETDRSLARTLLQEQYGIGGDGLPYALAVGVLQPRKNLLLLLRAFTAARRLHGFPHRLAVVGKVGWLASEIEAALRAGEASGDVVLVGYVPDDHLPLLYNCADLMCYPSLYEGFGLPPLEAMACGCPVAASDISSLPEVVGSAGALLDPRKPGEWIDTLGRVLLDPVQRRQMSVDGLAQASKFSWQQTARETLAVYKACHNSAGNSR